jgi:sugar (pentulose or hexulose) kinase
MRVPGVSDVGDGAGNDILLALDLGTTLIKALAYTGKGELLQSASNRFPLINAGTDGIEQDPKQFWDILSSLIRGITEKLGGDASRIQAVGLSSQGISVLPGDEGYAPLHNMLSWLDSRAVGEVEEIEGLYSRERLFRLTGKKLNALCSLPKILWIRNHRPDVFSRTARVLLPLDYIYHRLTGVPVTDHTMAGGTMLYDVNTRTWSDELFGAFDLLDELAEGVQPGSGRLLFYPRFKGVGTGLFRNCRYGYECMKDKTTMFEPDTRLVDRYDSLYARYVGIEQKLIGSSH